MNEVKKIPLEYRTIKTCGTWKAENKDGYYRIVVADVYDGAGSEIYAQWITNTTQERKSELIKTLAFPELNNDHSQYSIQTIDCKTKGKFTHIKLKALHEHDETNRIHNISIKLIDVGKYKYQDSIKK